MKTIVYHPEAEVDLDEAVETYEGAQWGLGERFRQAVLATETRIAENPGLGGPWMRGTRLRRVPKFSYGLVYKEYPDEIRLVAVYHFSRRETYWVHRLDDLPDDES